MDVWLTVNIWQQIDKMNTSWFKSLSNFESTIYNDAFIIISQIVGWELKVWKCLFETYFELKFCLG